MRSLQPESSSRDSPSSTLFFHGFSTDRCFVIASKYAGHLVVKKPDNKGQRRTGLSCRRAGVIEERK
jgi:hypothetical protein